MITSITDYYDQNTFNRIKACADIRYEDHKDPLPLNLSIEDRLYRFSTGAYATSYSAIEFNGFPPLQACYI